MHWLIMGFIALCALAVPVLLILFIVRWIMKKPKLWVGLSAVFCFLGVFLGILLLGFWAGLIS